MHMCLYGAEHACTPQHCSRVEAQQARGSSHPPAVGRRVPAGPGGGWHGQEPHCSRDRAASYATAPVAHAAAAAGQLHRILGLSQVRCQSVLPWHGSHSVKHCTSSHGSRQQKGPVLMSLPPNVASSDCIEVQMAATVELRRPLCPLADGICRCCCSRRRECAGHAERTAAGVPLSCRAEQGEQVRVRGRDEQHLGSTSSPNAGSGFRSDAIALEVSLQERLHDLQAQAGTRSPEQQQR